MQVEKYAKSGKFALYSPMGNDPNAAYKDRMKLFTAVDSFKGSLSSQKIRTVTEKAIKAHAAKGADLTCDCVSVGDGGEGTAEAFTEGLSRKIIRVPVTGKTGRKKTAKMYAVDGKIYLDCCAACGISAENRKGDALISFTSYGVGELLLAALKEESCEEVIIGLGGSGTVDGGAGMLAALGARFYDRTGREVGYLPSEIDRVARVDLSPARAKITKKLTVLCDTQAPLLGAGGAVALFAEQKGATAAGKRYLERTLGIFSAAAEQNLQELTAQENLQNAAEQTSPNSTEQKTALLPCGGAAGGLGWALIYLLGGEKKSGLCALFEERGYEERLKSADAVLCGEGLLDGTSFTGKVVSKIAELCEKHDKPLYLICGDAEPFLPLPDAIKGVYKLTDLSPVVAECICRAQEFYENRLSALLNDLAPIFAEEPSSL